MSYYLTKWLLQKTYVNIQGDPKGSERFFKNESGIQMDLHNFLCFGSIGNYGQLF